MKSLRNKFVALSAVGGLAVLGAACEAEDTESPGVEEPAGDVTVDEGTDTGLDTGTETETEPAG